jgi:exosome complex component RRP40
MPNAQAGTSSSKVIVVLPGDDVSSLVPADKKIRLGMGLQRLSNDDSSSDSSPARVVATLAGRLHHHRDVWFVWTNSKRYQPQPEDRVVGIVQDRMGSEGGADVYRVDVGAPHTCTLSSLQFEGATKRNRPIFNNGTILYARVVSGSQITDPVLSCQLGPKDQGIARKDWMTEEAAYGELKGGTLQKVPLGLARELLSPQSVVLEELSKLPFEIAVGVNGYLWIHAARIEYTILARNAILNSQVLTPEQTRAMVRTLMETVKKQMEQDDESDDEDEADSIQDEPA